MVSTTELISDVKKIFLTYQKEKKKTILFLLQNLKSCNNIFFSRRKKKNLVARK